MTTGQYQYEVFAVVVTYNRLELLKSTVAGLVAQTYKLKQIIVVNNDSSDGTKAWLDQQSGIIAIHQDNLGGAGGFHSGMKKALELKAEWVWVMDDDVSPDANCLEILLQHSVYSECLHPLRFDHDGTVQDEERWFDPATCKISSLFNASYNHGKKIWFRNIGSFEGMLVKSSLIEKIGLPDQRFFILHDDLVYGFLASNFTNVAVVADAVIRKLFVQKTENSVYAYLYYYFRNLWLVREYAEKSVGGLTTFRQRRIIIQFLYTAYRIFRFNEYSSKLKALQALYKGYRDYKRKLTGKTWQ